MKAALVLALIFIMSLTGIALAAENPVSNTDAKYVLDSIKEIRFNVEAGSNIVDYRNAVSKASVDYARYSDRNPSSNTSLLLLQALEPYKDANNVWNILVYKRHEVIFVRFEGGPLLEKYPELKSMVKIHDGAMYCRDVVKALWKIAAEREKIASNNLD